LNGLLTVFIIIRGIPKYEFGILTLFNTIDMGILAVSGGLVFQAMQKYAAESDGDELHELVSNSVFLYAFMSLIPAIIISLSGSLIAKALNAPGLSALLALLPIYVVSQWGRKIAYYLLLAKERVFEVFLLDLVPLIITAFLLLMLFFGGQLNSAKIVIGVKVAANLTAGILSFFLIRRITKLKWILSRDWLTKLLSFGKYTIGTTMGNIVYTRIDTVMITYFFDPVTLAVYNSARGIAEFFKNIVQAANMIVLPRASSFFSKNDTKGVRDIYFKGLAYSIALVVPISLVLLFMPEFILKLAYGGKYDASANILRILAFCALLSPLGSIGSSIAGGVGKPQFTLWAMSISVVINVVLNLLLIPRYGAIGAALATLVSISIGGLVITVLLQKRLTLAPKLNRAS
ncbi:flippase, partial [bacterium]|nr:flippase [bacterium]